MRSKRDIRSDKGFENRGRFRDKRGQQMFGMSFGIIFSILLIVFFIVIAFIVINKFLDIKKCTQVGLFIDDLQEDVDRAWNSQRASSEKSYSLPGNLNVVCFANLSRNSNGNELEREVYREFDNGRNEEYNMFLSPKKNGCGLSAVEIEHINLEDFPRNPYCFEIKDSRILIKIDKEFNEALVGLG